MASKKPHVPPEAAPWYEHRGDVVLWQALMFLRELRPALERWTSLEAANTTAAKKGEDLLEQARKVDGFLVGLFRPKSKDDVGGLLFSLLNQEGLAVLRRALVERYIPHELHVRRELQFAREAACQGDRDAALVHLEAAAGHLHDLAAMLRAPLPQTVLEPSELARIIAGSHS